MPAAKSSLPGAPVKTDIPARLDRLPWSRFHLLIVVGLGVTWILDGLEVTIVGALGPALQNSQTLHLSSADLGAVASFYVIGAVTGALVSGWVTDRFGRRLVFYATLIVYLAGVLLSAFAWNFLSFALFRMLTGMGIGGEYAAVNSAIDELIPAKYRGRIDLIVNGSFWVGAAAGAAITPLLLDQRLFAINVGWRLGFGIGGVLGLSILLLRRFVPESPRWLVTHCRAEEAEQTVREIEKDVTAASGRQLPPAEGSLTVHPRKSFGLGMIFASMLGKNRTRSILALVLMVAQSFLYNSVFFSYGIILSHFYHVPENRVGFYLLPLALGNFCGPLLLGTLVRYHRPPENDRRDIRDQRPSPASDRGVIRRGAAVGSNPNRRMAGDFLFRVGGGEFGLSHRQRDIPVGDPGAGDRLLLCDGDRDRRRPLAAAVRLADRVRFKLAGELRLCAVGRCCFSSRRARNGNSASTPKENPWNTSPVRYPAPARRVEFE